MNAQYVVVSFPFYPTSRVFPTEDRCVRAIETDSADNPSGASGPRGFPDIFPTRLQPHYIGHVEATSSTSK